MGRGETQTHGAIFQVNLQTNVCERDFELITTTVCDVTGGIMYFRYIAQIRVQLLMFTLIKITLKCQCGLSIQNVQER